MSIREKFAGYAQRKIEEYRERHRPLTHNERVARVKALEDENRLRKREARAEREATKYDPVGGSGGNDALSGFAAGMESSIDVAVGSGGIGGDPMDMDFGDLLGGSAPAPSRPRKQKKRRKR